ncbi:TIGR03745 family integrating conjugative element membrane protein [Pseudomonas chlororaphis]|uniref:TIGR03745 family integrating conjugative element membrane protein n=1 Tax=Pseudomonas chlororaphis subsp. aurantiaca TaxID=86192 RepID=A0AAJ0ZKD2_9PSED|nr:TIGR03745 family integrating conjugative element membrane protein [Pseudomonas chlororaphis]MBU4634034.1 TIGR03745 family integrating conjugative element membrane protein [Pseudomonas chlororaphis subsp. aurantiaca]
MSRNLKMKSTVAGFVALPQLASAALPQAQNPTRGAGTNILQTIQNWGFDGFMLIGLIVLGVMFLGVAWHAFGVYHDIHDGKKKWRDLGSTAAVGAGILGVGIFLVTQATGIL